MSEIQDFAPRRPEPRPTPGTASPSPVATPAPAPPAAPTPVAPSSPTTPTSAGEAPGPADALGAPKPDLRETVVQTLQTCYDPEIPVNIYDLGLVYGVDVTPAGAVAIQMTLTSPSCPVAETLPPDVQKKVAAIPGVTSAKVDVVWEPPWGKHLLSEAARLQLGLDGY
jgi:FeS assembly SUF system protein